MKTLTKGKQKLAMEVTLDVNTS